MSIMADQIPVLDTPRLTLRAPKLADLATLTAFFETERSHNVGGPATAPEVFSKLTSMIGHWALKGHGLWSIDSRESGDYLGWVGVICPPEWDEPELAWTVFAHGEGKGYAYEAARAARSYAAQEMNLNSLISYVRPRNIRSAALAERLGARIESTRNWRGSVINIYRHPTEAL